MFFVLFSTFSKSGYGYHNDDFLQFCQCTSCILYHKVLLYYIITVRVRLQIIDPAGVDIRSRRRLRRRQYWNKGPNYLWQVDRYDKLKPFGICMSGCIDGFSRKIMWLKAGNNSNDPKIIAGYYLYTVKSLCGCPQTLRADMGTENCVTERIQTALRECFANSQDFTLPLFLYGSSPANQRIESWWSVLRKHHSQFGLIYSRG